MKLFHLYGCNGILRIPNCSTIRYEKSLYHLPNDCGPIFQCLTRQATLQQYRWKTSFLAKLHSYFIFKLTFWLIWGVIVFHPSLFATTQVSDDIIINDKSYPLLTPLFEEELSWDTKEELLIEILKEIDSKNYHMAFSTCLRRGWKCTWRILNNYLYLENIEVMNALEDSSDNRDIRYISFGKPHTKIPHYHNTSNRYDYSGRLIIALGNGIGADRFAFSGSAYPAVMILDIRNGLVTKQNIAYCINSHNKGKITRYCKNNDKQYMINLLLYNQMDFSCTIDYSNILNCNQNNRKVELKSNTVIPISLEIPFDHKSNTKCEVQIAFIQDYLSLSFFVDNINQLTSEHQILPKDLSNLSYLHIVTYDDKGILPIKKDLEYIMKSPSSLEIYYKSFSEQTFDLFLYVNPSGAIIHPGPK
ncbi:MAG: hypothetical protein IJJ26_00980 [Victivallales bacterium]|nr:hypothetical protein [Victivallales bacterium]